MIRPTTLALFPLLAVLPLSAANSADNWVGYLTGKIKHAGRTFAPVTDKPWNVRREFYHGLRWFALECRKGDRRKHDSASIERIGLEGYPDPFPTGARSRTSFHFMPREHVLAEAPGQWTNFFELHSTAAPGDKEQAGPIIFVNEWSASAYRNVFRIRRNVASKNKAGQVTGLARSDVLYQGDMHHYGTYHFVVEAKDGQSGAIKVWLNGRLVVNVAGDVGYGGNRKLYPEFRIYRGARRETGKALVRIDEVTVT